MEDAEEVEEAPVNASYDDEFAVETKYAAFGCELVVGELADPLDNFDWDKGEAETDFLACVTVNVCCVCCFVKLPELIKVTLVIVARSTMHGLRNAHLKT